MARLPISAGKTLKLEVWELSQVNVHRIKLKLDCCAMKNAQITMKGLDMIVILNALQKEAGEMMDCFADSNNMEEELAIHGGVLMD